MGATVYALSDLDRRVFSELRASVCTQVPAHEQLAYMNVDYVNDVLNAPGIVVQGMQISHDKSPQRWKNVSSYPSRQSLFWHWSMLSKYSTSEGAQCLAVPTSILVACWCSVSCLECTFILTALPAHGRA